MSDIGELLDDAVAGVEPRQGVEQILARSASRRRSRAWRAGLTSVAAVAVVGAILAVTGLPGTGGADDAALAPAPVHHHDAVDPDSPVFISSPSDGDVVSSPFTVTGKATAFEGTVQWELKSGSHVVRRGFATAKVCCTLSPYRFTVTAPPGDYTLVVHDEDVSDGEGTPPARDTAQVHVQ